MIDELAKLKREGAMIITDEHPEGILLRGLWINQSTKLIDNVAVEVVGFCSDMPASKKMHGFISLAGVSGCSKCKVKLPKRSNSTYRNWGYHIARGKRPTVSDFHYFQDIYQNTRHSPWAIRTDAEHRRIARTLRGIHDFKKRERMSLSTGYRTTKLHDLPGFNSAR